MLGKILYGIAIFVLYPVALLLLLAAGVAISDSANYSANNECPKEYFAFSLCCLKVIWRWVADKIEPISAAITAFATIVIGIFTRVLSKSTQGLWDLERPHVELSGFEVLWHPFWNECESPMAWAEAKITLTNYGRTPARMKELVVTKLEAYAMGGGGPMPIPVSQPLSEPTVIAAEKSLVQDTAYGNRR